MLGFFGTLHPIVSSKLGLKTDPIIFSLSPEEIPDVKSKRRKSKLIVSDYQAVVRDFAFVVEEKIEFEEISRSIQNIKSDFIIQVRLFDVFEGSAAYEQIGLGKKSLGFEVRIQPMDRTLTDREIDNLCKDIIKEVNQVCGGILR